MQKSRNSSALAIELRLSCTNSSIYLCPIMIWKMFSVIPGHILKSTGKTLQHLLACRKIEKPITICAEFLFSTRYITNIWSHPSHYPLNLPTLPLSLKGYDHEWWIRIISSHVNRLFCSRDSVITNFDLENASCTCHALWKFRNDWTIKKVMGKRNFTLKLSMVSKRLDMHTTL